MGTLLYYIVVPVFYLLSVLPFRLLYLLSDFVYLLLYKVFGYRKDVVRRNLRNSFPDKSDKERLQIEKAFYRYLCDFLLEVFKTLTISKKSMLKHFTMDPGSLELINGIADKKQNVIIVMGHYGNWEWAGNTFSTLCRHQLQVIFHPLSNKKFNAFVSHMRQRFGTALIPMKETYKFLANQKDVLSATAFIADQTPQPHNAYWTTFLNQETGVFWGTERISRQLDYPVLYVSIRRLSRGYYTLFIEELVQNPTATAEGEISEIYTRRLEKDIYEQPEIWLWTHKRWKHKRPAENPVTQDR